MIELGQHELTQGYMKPGVLGLLDQAKFLADYSQASYASDKVPYTMFRDAISPHQALSKLWMALTLYDLGQVHIERLSYFGSWLGVGPRFLKNFMPLKEVYLVDQDSRVQDFGYHLCATAGIDLVVPVCMDMAMLGTNHASFKTELIVNTSIEHLGHNVYANWWEKLLDFGTRQKGHKRIVVLQGTNMGAADHRDFKDSGSFIYGGLDCIYKGALNFDDGTTRYMVIGRV